MNDYTSTGQSLLHLSLSHPMSHPVGGWGAPRTRPGGALAEHHLTPSLNTKCWKYQLFHAQILTLVIIGDVIKMDVFLLPVLECMHL